MTRDEPPPLLLVGNHLPLGIPQSLGTLGAAFWMQSPATTGKEWSEGSVAQLSRHPEVPPLPSLGVAGHEQRDKTLIWQNETSSGGGLEKYRFPALHMEKSGHFFRVDPRAPGLHLVNGFIAGVLQAQVHHRVLQGAAHVELQGQVINTLGRQSKTQHISLPAHHVLRPKDCTEVA